MGLSRNGTLFVGLLTTVNPLGIFFAQEARMYAQATAVGIASSWVLWRWLSMRTNRYPPGLHLAWLVIYAALAALLIQNLYRPVYHAVRFPVLVLPSFLLLIALTLERIPRSAIRLSFASLTLLLMTAATILQVVAITKHGMCQFADLYRDLGPPDHLVLLPPANTITASCELGGRIENANQARILASLASGRATEIWIGVERDYLETADCRPPTAPGLRVASVTGCPRVPALGGSHADLEDHRNQ